MPNGIQPGLPHSQIVPPQLPITPPTSETSPHILVKMDGEARAKHAEVRQNLGNILLERQIGTETLLSRDTVRELFGQSTLKAKVKDQAIHLLHKVSDRLAPDSKGSHLMEAKRLTDRYQEQLAGAASPAEKIQTLQALKNELSVHLGDVSMDPAKSFLELIDAEVALLQIEQARNRQELNATIDTLESRITVELKEREGSTEEDPGLVRTRHEGTLSEIRDFDRSTLRHVEVGEGSVPEWARQDVLDRVEKDSVLQKEGARPFSYQEFAPEPRMERLVGHLLPEPPFSTAGPLISRALSTGNEVELENMVLLLSDSISREVKSRTSGEEFEFATSTGEDFKKDLLEFFLSQLKETDAPLTREGKPTPEMSSLLDRIFNLSAAKLSNHQKDNGELVINGKTYRPDRKLGEGGFGEVQLYVAEDGGTLAVKKMSGQLNPDSLAQVAKEARVHQAAQGDGHPNVIDLKGVVRLPDGNLYIAMDSAPRGDVAGLNDKINQAVARGDLTPELARLMKLEIIRDMIQGMVHLQFNQGLLHLDIKGQNFLVSEDGRALLTDFGLSTLDVNSRFAKGDWANGLLKYTPPEVIRGEDQTDVQIKGVREEISELKGLKKQANTAYNAQAREVDLRVEAGELTPEEGEQEKERLLQVARLDLAPTSRKLEEAEARLKQIEQDNAFPITEKADTWAMAQVITTLLLGDTKFEDGTRVEIRRELRKFAGDDNSRVRLRNISGEGEGVTTLDRLLNRMMHPDPEQRPSLTDVLKSGLFQEPELGSQVIRDLIKAVTDNPPDSARIRELAGTI